MMTSRGTMTAKSWIPKLSQLTTLLLLVALCFGMISLSVAREQVDDAAIEPDPRDMTSENMHSVHIQFCVS